MAKKWGGTTAAVWRQRIGATLPAPCTRCPNYVMPGDLFDVDHITPVSAGGTDHPSNLGPAHRSCNRRHGQTISTARINAAKNKQRGFPNL